MDTTACLSAEVASPSPEFPGLRLEAVSAGFRNLGVDGPCNNSWQAHSRKFVTVIAGGFGALPFYILALKSTNRNVDLRVSDLVRTLGMAAFAPLFQALGLKVRHPSHCGDSNRFADLSAISAQSSANGQVCAHAPEPLLGTVDQDHGVLPPEEQAGTEFTCVCVLGAKSKRPVLDS